MAFRMHSRAASGQVAKKPLSSLRVLAEIRVTATEYITTQLHIVDPLVSQLIFPCANFGQARHTQNCILQM